jgi:hypothetical protein
MAWRQSGRLLFLGISGEKRPMGYEAPGIFELKQGVTHTGKNAVRLTSVLLSSAATLVWAGIILLSCQAIGIPVNGWWLGGILMAIFAMLLLGIGIAQSSSDRHD